MTLQLQYKSAHEQAIDLARELFIQHRIIHYSFGFDRASIEPVNATLGPSELPSAVTWLKIAAFMKLNKSSCMRLPMPWLVRTPAMAHFGEQKPGKSDTSFNPPVAPNGNHICQMGWILPRGTSALQNEKTQCPLELPSLRKWLQRRARD